MSVSKPDHVRCFFSRCGQFHEARPKKENQRVSQRFALIISLLKQALIEIIPTTLLSCCHDSESDTDDYLVSALTILACSSVDKLSSGLELQIE